MSKRKLPIVTVRLEKIVGGGQCLAVLEDGRKLFVWGGLPGETVDVQLTKKKGSYAEGVVVSVTESSPHRIEPRDPSSYLSTSPWQIMDFPTEQAAKAALIDEAFTLHHLALPGKSEVFSDNRQYEYRNKMEFSWWWDTETDQLDLAFYRRGTHSKVPVGGSSLAAPAINHAALRLRNILRKRGANGFQLKTALVRSNAAQDVALQLYVKDPSFPLFSDQELAQLSVGAFELIYSDPRSPASVITERLQQHGDSTLTDTVLGISFRYATEGFFQINLPVYEQALRDMQQWIEPDKPTLDLYSGVGSIGLTIGNEKLTMVELNPSAVREMEQNITRLGRQGATAVLAASEKSLDYITTASGLIVDPPRAGLDKLVVDRILEVKPRRIIYLSCSPVTQARDVGLLIDNYDIVAHRGYNFFPRTPHIEHLVVLDLKTQD
mgnify:FL=1